MHGVKLLRGIRCRVEEFVQMAQDRSTDRLFLNIVIDLRVL
jgi:hypothetical protein